MDPRCLTRRQATISTPQQPPRSSLFILQWPDRGWRSLPTAHTLRVCLISPTCRLLPQFDTRLGPATRPSPRRTEGRPPGAVGAMLARHPGVLFCFPLSHAQHEYIIRRSRLNPRPHPWTQQIPVQHAYIPQIPSLSLPRNIVGHPKTELSKTRQDPPPFRTLSIR